MWTRSLRLISLFHALSSDLQRSASLSAALSVFLNIMPPTGLFCQRHPSTRVDATWVFLLQTSLKRSDERPTRWCHVAIFLYLMPFAIWPSFIRCTWPSYRKWHWHTRKTHTTWVCVKYLFYGSLYFYRRPSDVWWIHEEFSEHYMTLPV